MLIQLVGILIVILVLGGATFLMILLFYAGEKSRRAERRNNRFRDRGFEVKVNASDQSPLESEKGNDHG